MNPMSKKTNPVFHPITKDQKDRWVKALRSGRYKQGGGRLCEVKKDGTKTYCCLGVLESVVTHRPVGAQGYLRRRSAALGVQSKRIDKNAQSMLASLNDSKGMSFDQIADVIHSTPLSILTGNKED